jgi:hypothetical protein
VCYIPENHLKFQNLIKIILDNFVLLKYYILSVYLKIFINLVWRIKKMKMKMKSYTIVLGMFLLLFASLVQAVIYEDFEGYTDTANMLANPIWYFTGSAWTAGGVAILDTTHSAVSGSQCLSVTVPSSVGTTSTTYYFAGWKFSNIEPLGEDLSNYSSIKLWYKGDANNPAVADNTARIEIKSGATTQLFYLNGAMTNPNWTMFEIPVSALATPTNLYWVLFRGYIPKSPTTLYSTMDLDRLEFVPIPEPATVGLLTFGALALIRKRK